MITHYHSADVMEAASPYRDHLWDGDEFMMTYPCGHNTGSCRLGPPSAPYLAGADTSLSTHTTNPLSHISTRTHIPAKYVSSQLYKLQAVCP